MVTADGGEAAVNETWNHLVTFSCVWVHPSKETGVCIAAGNGISKNGVWVNHEESWPQMKACLNGLEEVVCWNDASWTAHFRLHAHPSRRHVHEEDPQSHDAGDHHQIDGAGHHQIYRRVRRHPDLFRDRLCRRLAFRPSAGRAYRVRQ